MDGQDYLNQISASVRPEKKSSKIGDKFKSSPILKVLAIGVVALFLIIIIGSLFSGGGGESMFGKNLSLKLHIDNTIEIISTYQGKLKSSILRSSSASLNSILSNTSRDLESYMAEKYSSHKDGKEDEKIEEEATLYKDELNNDLFEAKISGNLDRIYAHKMAYEVSSIISEEISLYESTKDDDLKNILDTSYNSLDNLYNDFSDFSETK